jgi:hypothetical protein
MFPESRWVPYKLTHIDLSYNVMPVLTREILTGTKHLTHLNVSYNMLGDIRKGDLSVIFVRISNFFTKLDRFTIKKIFSLL